MKGQTNFILALVFALLVAVFAVINVDAVEVNYLFGIGQAPLILVILVSVLMGGVIAGAVGAVRFYRLQREIRTLKQKLQEYESTPLTNEAIEEEESNEKTESTP
ncbi:hypothetical protein N781_10795 [Pontibacillus halophilus JSM 076056 = DSM 19796]|uniref:Lipopolysaccharide assembly protein A domain-containing protein n=1 Tax=Pontibacillus halophilus JSM 076056 = DSM 19796 TaxID=1385510 RepID=A0A0A5GQM9_9BACI|nr:lipopolysaccharide assembly protein LapA domain-containing protein [Pontibacillus halophilus]KGX93513.1 hypothetical protein N781_10795 [Pontibacillus halophilus JSM 076056 = DSM 19796]